MRKLLLLILTLALVLSLTACPQTAQPETTPAATSTPSPTPTPEPEVSTLHVCLGTERYTIDPTFIDDGDTGSCVLHLFEGLMKYVPGNSSIGVSDAVVDYGMAESYTVSEDGLTYTFTLRENARWSDGTPVTAEDFVYSWRRAVSSGSRNVGEPLPGAHLLSGVVKNADRVADGRLADTQLGVAAVDERTFEVQLVTPCTYFPRLCASPCLVPLRRDVIEAYGGNWTDVGRIVTNGPYRVSAWVHDAYLKMERNLRYYDRKSIQTETIVWHFSDGEQLTLDRFRDGTYDFIGTFPMEQLAKLREEGVCHTLPRAGSYYLYFNTDAVADWRVRAAMVLAVDRESIVRSLGGDEMTATGLVPAGIHDGDGDMFAAGMSGTYDAMFNWLQAWHPDYDLGTYEGRCALAKALYRDSLNAGSWHRSYEVNYYYNSSEVNRTVVRACQKNWREVLGLTVNATAVDQSAYPSVLENGTFGIAYLSWMPDHDDAQNFLSLLKGDSAHNYGKWESAAFDELMTKVDHTLDITERDELQYYAENQMFSLGGFPVCPIFTYGDSYCSGETVTGVAYSGFGYYLFTQAGK